MIRSMNDQGDRDHGPGYEGEPLRERHWWARDKEQPGPPALGADAPAGGAPPGPPGVPRNVRRPDPGSPRAAWIAGVIALVLILAVAGLQQMAALGGTQQPPGVPTAPPVEAASATFEITAKIYTRVYLALRDPQVVRDAMANIEAAAEHPSDRLRVAIVEAELRGPDEALARIEQIEAELSELLREDAETLRQIYAGEDPSPERLAQLRANHGWFGDLAATYGLPPTDPSRQAAAGGGMLLLAVLGVLMVAVVAALLTGFVLLILAMVWFSSGRLRPRFVPPLPGGSVAIETVAVFVGGFLLLKVGAGVLAGYVGEGAATWAAMLAQWLLLLTLLWPVVRGVSASHTLGLWGIHRGRGIMREIGAGFVGYLACLPLLLIGVVTTLVLMFLYQMTRRAMGMTEAPPPQNPIFEIVGRPGGWMMVVLLFLLASLWAPLVEEAVFRGALYRHLRSRWHWLLSGIVTALVFGVMHGYQVFMLGPVIALGFGFALLREWRGSLIASITAHAIHNSVVLVVVIVVLRVIVA
jgi:membrane protease YdiL (CAAX protease family)